jgi:divalent metal cation (Fe/Co/Zn/Cd) transporter
VAGWRQADPISGLIITVAILAVRSVRMRWIGHRLHAEAELVIDPTTTLHGAHQLAHDAEHTLTHAVPQLAGTLVHAHGDDTHQVARP